MMHRQDTEGSLPYDQGDVSMPGLDGDCVTMAVGVDGNPIEFETANQPSPTDLETFNQMMQRRDLLLEATAKATNVLLTLENLDDAINMALKIIGEGTGCDLISVIENVSESASALPSHFNFIYEWAAPGFGSLTEKLGSTQLPAELLGLDFLERYFLRGEGFGGPLQEWRDPLRGLFASIHIQSAYSVPIRVNGQWWGVLCIDYCRAAIQIGSAEVSVLMTIADCIGSAIQRDRNRQEREDAAQQRAAELEEYNQRLLRRDRLLDATARAANVLLTLDSIDEAINTALRIILEGIGCDRINILENGYDPSSRLPTSYTTIYEWVVPDLEPSHIVVGPAQAATIDATFMEQEFLQGNGFGGLLEAWPEPLRSAFAAVHIQSAYSIAIRVNGQWWGVLCFEYCRAPIEISAAEVAVVRTIADCIGSAIERDRTQKIILQAEQTRVAELVNANSALKQSLDTLAADSDLDRFIGNTLKLIAQQCDSPLIEYWMNTLPDQQPQIHLTYWQGYILTAQERRQLPDAFWASGGGSTPLELHPFLHIPLTVGEINIGAIAIYLPRGRHLSRQIIELVHALAQQLTLAVELSRLAEEAQQAALLQERTRMAREIHDTLAQAFGGILMQLQAVNYFAATRPETAKTHLHTAQMLAQEGLAEARRSVWTLYLETTEYEDPAQTIAKFIEQTTSGQSVPVQLTIEGTPYRLHPDLGLNLLRIAQEAIANALRHAQAQSIQVHLSYGLHLLQLTIRDDGCGFDPQLPARGFGLSGMQQRATRIGATWHLISQMGQGTMITITLNNGTAQA